MLHASPARKSSRSERFASVNWRCLLAAAGLTTWRVDLPPCSQSGAHSLAKDKDKEQKLLETGPVTLHLNGGAVVACPSDALILPATTELELRNKTASVASAIVISAGFHATAAGHKFATPWSL